MKRSQLRKIVKNIIKEHIHPTTGDWAHHVDPNNPSATVASVYGGPSQLMGDGTHIGHYKANICPAKMAVHFTNQPINNIANWNWLNQQYSQANLATLGPAPIPNAQGVVPPNTQMFDCFQVHPVAEQWYYPMGGVAPPLGGNPGTFADLPQIMGQYSNIAQGAADGWLYPGAIAQCNTDCEQMAVNYDECEEPVGGCPQLGTPWGPIQMMWQGFPVCSCFSPSVGPGNTGTGIHTLDPTLTVATALDKELKCQCCDDGYPISMIPIPLTTVGGCSSWNGSGLSNCADSITFDPKKCKGRRGNDDFINCTCCDDLNPGTGLSPTPPIPVGTPGGCSSLNGPYGSTVLSGCAESSIWNVNSCEPLNPCDSWVDPGFQGGTCCEWCSNIPWPGIAPTNVSCGGVGTGGDPQGSNNWFCGCCDPTKLKPTEYIPTDKEIDKEIDYLNKNDMDMDMNVDFYKNVDMDTKRMMELANIKIKK